jgi:hypothetical protein
MSFGMMKMNKEYWGTLLFEYHWKYPSSQLDSYIKFYENGMITLFSGYNSGMKEKREPTKYYLPNTKLEKYKFIFYNQITSIHPMILTTSIGDFRSLRVVVDKGTGKYLLFDIPGNSEGEVYKTIVPQLELVLGDNWKLLYKKDEPIIW